MFDQITKTISFFGKIAEECYNKIMKRFKNAAMATIFSAGLIFSIPANAQTSVSHRPSAKLPTPDSTSIPYKAYSHGDPTHLEQLLLEYTNRCRANPYADILRIVNGNDARINNALNAFNVDKNELTKDFSTYSPKPPLAFNEKLITAARNHSTHMAINNYQGHGDYPNGPTTLAERLTAVNYTYSYAGENVYAYAYSPWHAHAAFVVDWGVQDLGHRIITLDLGERTDFREIGIGIIEENISTTTVGPLVVTQEFGLDNDQVAFITGVVYLDANENSAYDLNEGLANVQVTPDRGDYYALTSTSGGFAVPIALHSGTYTLTITRPDIAPMQATVQIASQKIKVDFPYSLTTRKGEISGKIIDSSPSSPLPTITLQLSPGNLTTTTANDGTFSFTNLPTGNYTLTASKEGYIFTPNPTPIALAPGQTLTIELKAYLDDNPIIPDGGCGLIGMVLMGIMLSAFKGLSITPRKHD